MESLVLPHLPTTLHIALFTSVRNSAFLRAQLLAGNKEFEYAFVDPETIFSRAHALAACFRALNDAAHSRGRCRNVHADIVYSLSMNSNVSFVFADWNRWDGELTTAQIAESLRRFGIADGSKHVLVVKVSGHVEEVRRHLIGAVEGELVPFTDEKLAELRDPGRIRTLYRLAKMPGEGTDAEAQILAAMALKGS